MNTRKLFVRAVSFFVACVILLSALSSCGLLFKKEIVGDCNGDGKVNAKDTNILSRHLFGENTSLLIENADINADSSCGDADLKLLIRYLAETYLPGQRFSKIFINGTDIENYLVVIPKDANDFEKWTAQILKDRIEELSNVKLRIVDDSQPEEMHEILIGKTARKESQGLTAKKGQYLIFSKGSKIVLRGENYYVAGGAGFIISSLDSSKADWNTQADVSIPTQIKSRSVEWKSANKVMLLIGDGMGLNHTVMASDSDAIVEYAGGVSTVPEESTTDIFWPSTFDNQGLANTLNIQNSTTDSAAAATALATGYRTLNGALGMIPADLDGDGEEEEFRTVQNVREAATLAGMSTSVLSTDKLTGATPNAFIAHHYSRKDKKLLLEQQKALDSTRLDCSYLWCSYDSDDFLKEFKKAIDVCDDNPDGFFIMAEEAMIDKYGEKMDYDNVIRTVKRFNTVTAYAATYAVSHPDTVLVITADHETGGLTLGSDNVWRWTSDGEHTGTDVPVFALGKGTKKFNGSTCKNTDIAKFLFKAVNN